MKEFKEDNLQDWAAALTYYGILSIFPGLLVLVSLLGLLGKSATQPVITGLTKAISLEGRPFGIACGQIDVGNAATELTAGIAQGALQPDGSRRPEPMMDVRHAADAVVQMAELPLDANVEFMTIMATNMPLVGRG